MIKAVIIDDEAKARRILEALLQEYCPDIEVLASSADVPSGVLAINKHQPHVVFLDVEMPGYTGFQLLEFFNEVNFEIIFTTAHSDYALQAFKVSAIDYLLKPIRISELVKAVDKLKKIQQSNGSERLHTLKENFKENEIRRVALPVAEGLIFVVVDDILYLAADGSYTRFFLAGGKEILVSKKIKEFEGALNIRNNFFRPHRSYIVNIKAIKQYVKQDGGYILLQNDIQIPLARERKEDFLQLVKEVSLG